MAGKHLEGVLGVFQKLLASRAHDHEGFFVLNSLMEFLPLDVFRGYLPTIWTLLFRRRASSVYLTSLLCLPCASQLHVSTAAEQRGHMEGILCIRLTVQHGKGKSTLEKPCSKPAGLITVSHRQTLIVNSVFALHRLESAPTAKYSRGLVVFIAFFMCKHGGPAVLDSIDALQPQPPLSTMILDSVWAPTLPQVWGLQCDCVGVGHGSLHTLIEENLAVCVNYILLCVWRRCIAGSAVTSCHLIRSHAGGAAAAAAGPGGHRAAARGHSFSSPADRGARLTHCNSVMHLGGSACDAAWSTRPIRSQSRTHSAHLCSTCH